MEKAKLEKEITRLRAVARRLRDRTLLVQVDVDDTFHFLELEKEDYLTPDGEEIEDFAECLANALHQKGIEGEVLDWNVVEEVICG